MSLRNLALAAGALLTVWTGSASAGSQDDTFRLGMTGDADVMTLGGRGDADTILVGRGGGRGGWGGGRGGWGGARAGWGGGRGGWGGWHGGWGGRVGWRSGWGGWRGGWWGGRRFGWGGWGGWYSPWYYGWGYPWVGYGLSYYPPAYNYWSPAYAYPSYYGCSLNDTAWTQPDSTVAPSGSSVPRQPDLLPPPTRSPGSGTFQYDGGPPRPVPLPQGSRPLNPQPPLRQTGTYDYDGGPARPIPIPQGQRAPTFAPQTPTPEGRVVSLPATAKRPTYLAYGEQSRSSGPSDTPVIRVAQKSSR